MIKQHQTFFQSINKAPTLYEEEIVKETTKGRKAVIVQLKMGSQFQLSIFLIVLIFYAHKTIAADDWCDKFKWRLFEQILFHHIDFCFFFALCNGKNKGGKMDISIRFIRDKFLNILYGIDYKLGLFIWCKLGRSKTVTVMESVT